MKSLPSASARQVPTQRFVPDPIESESDLRLPPARRQPVESEVESRGLESSGSLAPTLQVSGAAMTTEE